MNSTITVIVVTSLSFVYPNVRCPRNHFLFTFDKTLSDNVTPIYTVFTQRLCIIRSYGFPSNTTNPPSFTHQLHTLPPVSNLSTPDTSTFLLSDLNASHCTNMSIIPESFLDWSRAYFKTDALSASPAAPEVPKPIDLSVVGKDRCQYIVKVATEALDLISRLEYRKSMLTKEEFVAAYRTQDPDHEERIAFICLKFVSIYEIISKLGLTWELYHDVFQSRFPVIKSWTQGSTNATVRLPRNSIAHGFEVTRPYWEDCDEETALKKFSTFSPSSQWNTMEIEIPALEKELRNLVDILEEATSNIPETDMGVEENEPFQDPVGWQSTSIPAPQVDDTNVKSPRLEEWDKPYTKARQIRSYLGRLYTSCKRPFSKVFRSRKEQDSPQEMEVEDERDVQGPDAEHDGENISEEDGGEHAQEDVVVDPSWE